MKPEDGRIALETMQDVKAAEHSLLLYNQAHVDKGTQRVRIASDEAQLPLALSRNNTARIIEVMKYIHGMREESGPLNPELAENWLTIMGVTVEPVVNPDQVISIADRRKGPSRTRPIDKTAA